MGFRRALTLLVLATLVPLLAFSAFAVLQTGRGEHAAAEQALAGTSRALAATFDKHVDATITALRVLGSSEQLEAGDLAAFHRQCLRALEARGEWRTINLFDPTGRRVLNTSEPFGAPLPGPPPVMTEPFRRLIEAQTPNVSDLFPAPLTGHLVVSVGVPIVRGGQVRWVISAGLSPDALVRLTTGVAPAGGSARLIDRRGHALGAQAASDPASLITAQSRSSAYEWTAAVSAPVITSFFERMVRAIPGFGALVLVVGLAAAVWAARRMSRPLEALAEAARQIGRGEPVRPVASGITEVAALSAALVSASEERLAAEARAAKYNEQLQVLQEIDRGLIASQTPAAIAKVTLPRLRDLLGVPRVIVNLFNLEEGIVEWLAAAGRRRVWVGPGVRYSLALAGDIEALRRGEPQVIDVDALPGSPEKAALLASGVHVYLVVPMLTHGVLIGSVSVGAERGPFPPEQVAIVQGVATQMAIAIAHAQLSERAQAR